MKNRLSRRQFLGATVATGAAVIAPFEAKAVDVSAHAVVADVPSDSRLGSASTDLLHAGDRYEEIVRNPVYKMELRPHWFDSNSQFWYRNDLKGGNKEFIAVDAVKGLRSAAFDHARLASALSSSSGSSYSSDSLPFELIELNSDRSILRFDIADQPYSASLGDYTVRRLPSDTSKLTEPEKKMDAPANDNNDSSATDQPVVSPDGKLTASVEQFNLIVTDAAGQKRVLTVDGTADNPYGSMDWSPDSRTIVAYRIDPVVVKKVYMVESSPKEWSSRGILHEHEYAQPGDPFSRYQMWLFDALTGDKKAATVDVIDFGDAPDLKWDSDGKRFSYEYMDRGYQRFRVIAVDIASGRATTLVDDKSSTFVDSTNVYTWYADDHSEIIYASERSGWRHLYLVDGFSGSIKNAVTSGKWVVRTVDRVDANSRQIWFSASGVNNGEDPYHLHKYRVGFDGTGLICLTGGDGTHRIDVSPDNRFVIDTYSRAELAPVHTLRSGVDGKLVCALETADISALTTAGWKPPQVFSAKGRDGQTDIWGVVFRPLNYRPGQRYPVIENIYAGPQDSFVRKTFTVTDSMQALAELGFVVVQCDGMGTRNRSKLFQDVCWRNIKDAGFPDRIAWITALAKTDRAIDIARVGIYGTSAGGQNSTGALLFHPEFYKVAVSSCGCHDNRIDKQWWNEQWMGYPVGPWYEESSNIVNAHRLLGKLMLFVGELDTNVPPESTIRLTDALIKAGKDFDLVVITGSDHTDGGAYGERRRRDYFIRHLLGVEPPNRNIPTPPLKAIALSPLPPSAAQNAEAGAGSATTIKFVNNSKKALSFYWMNGDGGRTLYGTIEPGQQYQQNTYVGHTWLVVGADGVPIAAYVGALQPGIATISQ